MLTHNTLNTLRHLKPSAKVTVPELNESFEV